MADHAAAGHARARQLLQRAEKHIRRARQASAQAAADAGVLHEQRVADDVDLGEVVDAIRAVVARHGAADVVVLADPATDHSPGNGAQTRGNPT